MLEAKRVQLITQAAQRLDFCHMIRFDERSGNFAMTDLGRVASHYYIHNGSIETFNTIMDKGAAAAAATGAGAPMLTDVEALDLICAAEEFKNIKVSHEHYHQHWHCRVVASAASRLCRLALHYHALIATPLL